MQTSTDGLYRPVSTSAAFSVAAGVLSFWSLVHPDFLVLSIVGILVALRAILQFRRWELVGRRLAHAGFGLSATALVSGLGWHAYRHVIEVPPGYERLSFSRDIAVKHLQESEGRCVIDPHVTALAGRRVSLRGYACPADNSGRAFLLTIDDGPSGFGSTLSVDHTVFVQLPAGAAWDFDPAYLAVSGEFEIAEQPTSLVEGGRTVYRLRNAIVRKATSAFGDWTPRKKLC